jgi:plasmid stabilization system protein ParE
MRLRLHRLAVEEIDHEVDYYESRQSGLGAELEDEIDAALDVIVRMPYAAPQWKNRQDRRVAVLARFPFTLPYQIIGDEIVVLALAHMSRRPAYWRARTS